MGNNCFIYSHIITAIVLSYKMSTSHQSIVLESSAKSGSGPLKLDDPKIKQALDDVWSNDSDITWAKFTYIPNVSENIIQVADTGDGEILEMVEELNPSEICYVYYRHNAGGKSPKFVYISWAPDGVPASLKGMVGWHAQEFQQKL